MNDIDKNIHGRIFRGQSFIATLILFASVAVPSTVYALTAHKMTKQDCYNTLLESTSDACDKIENNFKSDRSSLRMLARVISQEDDLFSGTVNNQMTAYEINSTISNIAILTPDNTIIPVRGENIESNDMIDFKTELALGDHVSDLRPFTLNPNIKVMQSFIPIRKNGNAVGILFAELNPDSIVSAWSPEIYNGETNFCIVNRTTGKILVNSNKDSSTDINNSNLKSIAAEIKDGKTGYASIELGKDDTIASYMPMEMENWEILFTVKTSKVLETNNHMQKSLILLFSVIATEFLTYLLWIMTANRSLYEKFCIKNKYNTSGLSCIYIDANGLHEINNTKGHLAGDMMLIFIAETLKQKFKGENIFRIGGDEFVIFSKHKPGELQKNISLAAEEMQKNDYHISAGIFTANENNTMDELIKSAELIM